VAGSLFINAADPGYLYGYGSSALSTDNTTQNTIVKIKLSDGTYTDVAAGGAAVSQSDGAGCPTATFQEPKPVANPDQKLDNTNGTTVTVSPITGNDVVVGGTIDKTTVSLVPPAGATDIVTDAHGDVISMTIPNEGTWTVDPVSGDITFKPLSTFKTNPTVILYNVEDDKGNQSNDATVTVTYLTTLPVNLISFIANITVEKVNLTWKTANEKNFSHFDVQSSADAKEFATIGTEATKGLTNYNFTDNTPNENTNYYRLKMVDLDGSFKYSNIISVNFKKDSEYLTVQNPAKNGIIEIATNYKNANLILLNSMGQKYNISPVKTGSNSYMINVSNLTSGIFYLGIISDNKIETKKILIQN
jgi:Surface adhesin CshA repetitive domain